MIRFAESVVWSSSVGLAWSADSGDDGCGSGGWDVGPGDEYCLACACRVEAEHPGLFKGSVWASPSDTSYHNFSAGDVVVVEPPHRGDRDHTLDRLCACLPLARLWLSRTDGGRARSRRLLLARGRPFHEMVKRSYSISAERREAFLEEFDAMLGRFGV